MTRMSKQGERRNQSPRRPKLSGGKTGPRNNSFLLRSHENALASESLSEKIFIPKIK